MENSVKDKLFLITVIILVGLIGFGLGRLSSKYQTAKLDIKSTIANTTDLGKIVTSSSPSSSAPDKVSKTNQTSKTDTVSASAINVSDTAVKIVGNKSSKIYHREDCPGALKMSESNKIFFDSIQAAKEAGYRPAGNCPGLE